MIVPFTNKEAYVGKFDRAQTRMWRERNDDQHMWICGSFFQFSAGDGWEGLKGFDLSPEGANSDQGIKGAFAQKKGLNTFAVQATKAYQEVSIDEADPEKSFSSRMWLLPTVQERDKQLLAPRLARVYNFVDTEEEKDSLVENVGTLPSIYEVLIKMDQYAFPFSMQAQLATDLVTTTAFNGNDEQMLALRMGECVVIFFNLFPPQTKIGVCESNKHLPQRTNDIVCWLISKLDKVWGFELPQKHFGNLWDNAPCLWNRKTRSIFLLILYLASGVVTLNRIQLLKRLFPASSPHLMCSELNVLICRKQIFNYWEQSF